MKVRKPTAFCASLLVSLSSLMAFAPAVHAATITQDGDITSAPYISSRVPMADPIIAFATTALLAGAFALLARRYNKLPAR